MYAVFADCDPKSAGQITSNDQVSLTKTNPDLFPPLSTTKSSFVNYLTIKFLFVHVVFCNR